MFIRHVLSWQYLFLQTYIKNVRHVRSVYMRLPLTRVSRTLAAFVKNTIVCPFTRHFANSSGAFWILCIHPPTTYSAIAVFSIRLSAGISPIRPGSQQEKELDGGGTVTCFLPLPFQTGSVTCLDNFTVFPFCFHFHICLC